MPKKAKELTRQLTQAELIMRALETEDINILEHRNYLSQEEEKRRRARIVRKSISGPLLRWVSKTSSELVPQEPFPQPTYYAATLQDFQNSADNSTSTAQYSSTAASGIVVANQDQPITSVAATGDLAVKSQAVTKNFLIHELDQREGAPLPAWEGLMTAIFGNHVDWTKLKVFAGKHRPLHRPIVKCPITGKTAPYRDRRTGVPYANVTAYKILTHLLQHGYIWNDSIGSYTADADDISRLTT